MFNEIDMNKSFQALNRAGGILQMRKNHGNKILEQEKQRY